MNDDHKWMKLAILEANIAKNEGEIPVGAILIKDGELLSKGHNQPILKNDPTAHAEIQVIRNAAVNLKNYRLLGTTLYVTLEPCSMCLGALMHARVERLVFGAYGHKELVKKSVNSSKKFNHKMMITGGILEKSCKELLEVFFKSRR